MDESSGQSEEGLAPPSLTLPSPPPPLTDPPPPEHLPQPPRGVNGSGGSYRASMPPKINSPKYGHKKTTSLLPGGTSASPNGSPGSVKKMPVQPLSNGTPKKAPAKVGMKNSK